MTFSIIGTGNIAWFFGSRLVTGRHHCMGVYGSNPQAALLLKEALLADKSGNIEDLADGEADVCFLLVSDTAISEIAAGLSFTQTVLIQSAGAASIDLLQPSATDYGVIWPVYSIVKTNPPSHRNIPCGWEFSTEKAKRLGLEMAHAITDILFETRYDQRKWLHLSAVISNNFTNHLLAVCEQICKENELPFNLLMPIIEQTFDRIKTASPGALQTGPAIRKDTPTIQSQINLLSDHPEWQKIYEDITKSIQAGVGK